MGELLQRLADDSAADVEVIRQLNLGDALPGLELARNNGFADDRVDLFARGLLLHLIEYTSDDRTSLFDILSTK